MLLRPLSRTIRLLPSVTVMLVLSACLQNQHAPRASRGLPSRVMADRAARTMQRDTAVPGAGDLHVHALRNNRGAASGVALLMEASRQGNESLVRTQLAEGVRVNAIDRNGETALSHAIRHERHDVALLLIAEGANVNVRDAQGNTPLNCLCLGPSHYPLFRDSADSGNYSLARSFYPGRRRVLKALLAANADVNLRDAEGVTPLMRALWCGWQPSVNVLVVDAGANTRAVDARTFSAEELSRWPGVAAQSLSSRSRVKSGVLNTPNALSETIVASGEYEPMRFTAVYRTEGDVIRSLLAAGADPNGRNSAGCKVEMGPAGGTPLVVAAAMGDDNIVDMLLKARADVNACDAQGRTALMHAAMRGDGSMARRLLSAGADRGIKDYSGRSAAQYAAAKGYKNLASMLENPSAYRRFINAVSNLFN